MQWHRERDFAETGALGYYTSGVGNRRGTRFGRVWCAEREDSAGYCWWAEAGGKAHPCEYQVAAKAWVQQAVAEQFPQLA